MSYAANCPASTAPELSAAAANGFLDAMPSPPTMRPGADSSWGRTNCTALRDHHQHQPTPGTLKRHDNQFQKSQFPGLADSTAVFQIRHLT
jgi:hypothetical protein